MSVHRPPTHLLSDLANRRLGLPIVQEVLQSSVPPDYILHVLLILRRGRCRIRGRGHDPPRRDDNDEG